VVRPRTERVDLPRPTENAQTRYGQHIDRHPRQQHKNHDAEATTDAERIISTVNLDRGIAAVTAARAMALIDGCRNEMGEKGYGHVGEARGRARRKQELTFS